MSAEKYKSDSNLTSIVNLKANHVSFNDEYDVALLSALEGGDLALDSDIFYDFNDNTERLIRWNLTRKDSLIGEIFHLPLLQNTVFRLDVFAMQMILRSSVVAECAEKSSFMLRASTLQHPDFAQILKQFTNDERSTLSKLHLFISFNEAFDNGNVDFSSNIELIKNMVKAIYVDSYGHGNASVMLLDQFDFDGVRLNQIFKELAGMECHQKLLIQCVVEQLKLRGKLIIAPVIVNDVINDFYSSLGCDMHMGRLDPNSFFK